MEEFLKAIPVYLLSTLKFILGPTAGFALNLHFLTTLFATVMGMMTAVVLFTYFGDWVRRRWLMNRAPKPPNPRWVKYGLPGIAILTPLFLTPIGGTILAVSSGSPKEKIIFYMFISAAAWGLIFTSAIYFVGREVIEWLPDFAK